MLGPAGRVTRQRRRDNAGGANPIHDLSDMMAPGVATQRETLRVVSVRAPPLSMLDKEP